MKTHEIGLTAIQMKAKKLVDIMISHGNIPKSLIRDLFITSTNRYSKTGFQAWETVGGDFNIVECDEYYHLLTFTIMVNGITVTVCNYPNINALEVMYS
jgi:hypothetical protein